MTETYLTVDELVRAFPANLRQDALRACAAMPAAQRLGQSFSVKVRDESVTIPGRLHFNPDLIRFNALSPQEREIVDCLLTRNSDGFVREQHLARIISLSRFWIPPFVVQLAGEPVVEILNVVYRSLPALDTAIYGEFIQNNPKFLDLTSQRVASYWNCYYPNETRQEYVGYKILEFFRGLRHSAGTIAR